MIDNILICMLGMFFNQHMYFLKIQGYETCMYTTTELNEGTECEIETEFKTKRKVGINVDPLDEALLINTEERVQE
jgi:hypothetical protein